MAAGIILLTLALGIMMVTELLDEKLLPTTRRTVKIIMAIFGVVILFAVLNSR